MVTGVDNDDSLDIRAGVEGCSGVDGGSSCRRPVGFKGVEFDMVVFPWFSSSLGMVGSF